MNVQETPESCSNVPILVNIKNFLFLVLLQLSQVKFSNIPIIFREQLYSSSKIIVHFQRDKETLTGVLTRKNYERHNRYDGHYLNRKKNINQFMSATTLAYGGRLIEEVYVTWAAGPSIGVCKQPNSIGLQNMKGPRIVTVHYILCSQADHCWPFKLCISLFAQNHLLSYVHLQNHLSMLIQRFLYIKDIQRSLNES